MRIRRRFKHTRSSKARLLKEAQNVGKRLITVSHESYASQDEARSAGRHALDRIILESARRSKALR